jgi:GGDEF domain-containing protein
VIFPDCGRDEAATIMERVDRAIAEAGRELPYFPALSWGIASMAELAPSRETCDGADGSRGSGEENSSSSPCVEDFLELADRRMYERKRDKGRSLPQRGARQ